MVATPTARATVLVADHSPFARAWAERLLGDAGHAVATAPDGERAYALARSAPPDVLVADETMPGLSGRALIRALRAGDDDIGTVLLASSPEDGIEADALRLGADQFLRTPCSADALARAVAAARLAGGARRARRERETHNAGEMRAATAIQAALLPTPVALPAGWTVETGFLPSRDVGGDVLDVLLRDERTLVVAVADVSGKGVAGALFAAMFRTAIRAALDRGDDVAAALTCAAALMGDDLERAGRFLTATVVTVDLSDGAVRYADAGHGHHLLLGTGGDERPLAVGGPPVGFLAGPGYALGTETLAPGERLALFSDGLVEGGEGDDPATARAALARRIAGGTPAGRLAADAPDGDDRTIVIVGRPA